MPSGNRWTAQEVERLREIMWEHRPIGYCDLDRFPGRTLKAIHKKLKKMRKAAKIVTPSASKGLAAAGDRLARETIAAAYAARSPIGDLSLAQVKARAVALGIATAAEAWG